MDLHGSLFFIIETSSAMDGAKIATVNDAMRTLLSEIKKYREDIDIKLAVMQFSSGAKWITQIPMDFGDFSWNDLQACGRTDFGKACEFLDSKLDKDEFLKNHRGTSTIGIILMSDGRPTDEFTSGVGKLKENYWFKHAIKIAFAFGDDANKDVLQDFTGSYELIISDYASISLSKWILQIIGRIFITTDILIPYDAPLFYETDCKLEWLKEWIHRRCAISNIVISCDSSSDLPISKKQSPSGDMEEQTGILLKKLNLI